MFIEPTKNKSAVPVIDELTKIMTAAFRQAEDDPDKTLGWHECICGAKSATHDFRIPDHNLIINSLCIHYLACHREEVPQDQLDLIASLAYDPEEPTEKEMKL